MERRDLYNKALNLVGSVADMLVNDLTSAEELGMTDEEFIQFVKYIDEICSKLQSKSERDEDM
jgi:hypothetical protein